MNNANKQKKTITWERLDLFKKTGQIKETFHARMGTVKDRNDKDLTEAEAIKKKWQGYTELYKSS